MHQYHICCLLWMQLLLPMIWYQSRYAILCEKATLFSCKECLFAVAFHYLGFSHYFSKVVLSTLLFFCISYIFNTQVKYHDKHTPCGLCWLCNSTFSVDYAIPCLESSLVDKDYQNGLPVPASSAARYSKTILLELRWLTGINFIVVLIVDAVSSHGVALPTWTHESMLKPLLIHKIMLDSFRLIIGTGARQSEYVSENVNN